MDHDDDRVLSTHDTVVPETQTQMGNILNNLLFFKNYFYFLYDIFFIGSSSGTKKTRGPTMMTKFFKDRREDIVRKEVMYNEFGEPIGDISTQLSTFIGILARRSDIVPWDCRDWRTVQKTKKEEILAHGNVSKYLNKLLT